MSAREPRKIESLSPETLRELEGDWRAGLLPLRVLATKYRVDQAELRAYARKVGWEHGDLGGAIRGATTAELVKRAVAERPAPAGDTSDPVRQYGAIVAGVVEGHRGDISRARKRVAKYIEELEELDGPAIDESAISGLIDLIGDGNPELTKVLKRRPKALLPVERSLEHMDAKASILKNLVASEAKLIELERQAWALDQQKDGGGATYDDFLAELYGEDNAGIVRKCAVADCGGTGERLVSGSYYCDLHSRGFV